MNKLVDGELIAMTEEEIAADQPTDAWILEKKWMNVRMKRNALLAESDYRALSDLTLTDDWRTYRQALRDVPAQSDPDNITWPTEPN